MYVKFVGEDFENGDENRCGKLNVPMHGTRDAAPNWHQHYKGHILTFGFRQAKSNLCIFRRDEENLRLFMHGGDYVASGYNEELTWLAKRWHPNISAE